MYRSIFIFTHIFVGSFVSTFTCRFGLTEILCSMKLLCRISLGLELVMKLRINCLFHGACLLGWLKTLISIDGQSSSDPMVLLITNPGLVFLVSLTVLMSH